MSHIYKSSALALALGSIFASSTNASNQIVCDETNSTDIVLLEIRSEYSQSTQGSIYLEIDAMNLGSVPNLTPFTYNIYPIDANGNRIEPAVEVITNPFPFQPQQLVTRLRYTNNLVAGEYWFEIDYPCSTNTSNNTLIGSVPGTITRPPDGIFRDGFESPTTLTFNKLANNVVDYVIEEHVYSDTDAQISIKKRSPKLSPQ